MKSLGFQVFIFSSLVESLKNKWWRNVLYCKNGHMAVPQEVRFVFFQHLWESKLLFPRLLDWCCRSQNTWENQLLAILCEAICEKQDIFDEKKMLVSRVLFLNEQKLFSKN